MSLSAEKLGTLLRSGDAMAIGKLFGRASEPDRRAFVPQVLAWCQRLSLNWRAQFNTKAAAEVERSGAIDNWHELMPAANTAALACASLAEIKALEDHRFVDEDAAVAVLAERRPPWIDEYAEFLCAAELRTGGGSWKQVRALVKSGLCRPPRHENYVLDALNGVRPWYEPGKAQPALAELLLAEHDWLESDFWRLFEHDGNGEVSLASYEKYGRSQQTWSEALVELSQRGALSRDRLLDASLAALARDFIQFRAGWFSRFHEALDPTPAERAARVDAYLHLLASSIPPTVSFALQAVAEVDAVHPLSAAKLAGALPPVLNARGKAVVKTALRLLEAAAAREPRERPAICLAALPALLHVAADVQKVVFDLLEVTGDKRDAVLRAKVAEFAGAVAASLKPRLASWSGVASLAAANTAAPSFPPVLSRIDPSRAIIPIANLDDLIHAAGAILEEPSNPDEMERVLDGICRFCDQRPDDFEKQTAPLRKRAFKKRDQAQGWGPPLERGLAMLVLTWLDGTDGFTERANGLGSGHNAYAFLFQRLNVVGRQARERPALPLLSAPTHRDGWIEPRVLVGRWLAWQKSGRDMDVHEQVVALLRLAPEGRDVARKATQAATGEAGHALRVALGDDGAGAHAAGRTAALWLAAWRSRQPFGDLPEFESAFPGLGPDAGFAARYSWGAKCVHEKLGTQVYARLKFGLRTEPACPSNPAGDLLPVLFHRRLEASEGLVRDEIRWMALLWPANREAFFAQSAKLLPDAVGYADTSDRELCAFLEPLAEPHLELRPMACLALALGLAAQDNALRGHAQDALIAVIAEDRLPGDGDGLGEALARLLDSGFNKFTRWAKSLREVARIGPHHARAAAALLTRALHADPARAPRDIGALLELLFELLSETGGKVSDGPARECLGGLAAGGKTARLAKQLLALR